MENEPTALTRESSQEDSPEKTENNDAATDSENIVEHSEDTKKDEDDNSCNGLNSNIGNVGDSMKAENLFEEQQNKISELPISDEPNLINGKWQAGQTTGKFHYNPSDS